MYYFSGIPVSTTGNFEIFYVWLFFPRKYFPNGDRLVCYDTIKRATYLALTEYPIFIRRLKTLTCQRLFFQPYPRVHNVDGLEHDCGISCPLTMDILQFDITSSMYRKMKPGWNCRCFPDIFSSAFSYKNSIEFWYIVHPNVLLIETVAVNKHWFV